MLFISRCVPYGINLFKWGVKNKRAESMNNNRNYLYEKIDLEEINDNLSRSNCGLEQKYSKIFLNALNLKWVFDKSKSSNLEKLLKSTKKFISFFLEKFVLFKTLSISRHAIETTQLYFHTQHVHWFTILFFNSYVQLQWINEFPTESFDKFV